MVMIIVKYVSLDYFEIDEIDVFIHITHSTFSITNEPRR